MAGYPIPTNTVVGRLLKAQNRHPFRPAHLHILIFKQGYKTLTSQVYAPDDPRWRAWPSGGRSATSAWPHSAPPSSGRRAWPHLCNKLPAVCGPRQLVLLPLRMVSLAGVGSARLV